MVEKVSQKYIYKTVLGGFLAFDHEMINEMDDDE